MAWSLILVKRCAIAPLLDDIGEVPLGMQAKSLRALQEQEIVRLGDTRPRKVDVRIVAATNRDLKRDNAVTRRGENRPSPRMGAGVEGCAQVVLSRSIRHPRRVHGRG